MSNQNFNPRSREGSDYYTERKNYKFEYFNPRSREGSDALTADQAADKYISIHAPTKGATFADSLLQFPFDISIHAPTKGATPLRPAVTASAKNFNPRSREGSDEREKNKVKDNEISIHAPTKGATCESTARFRFFSNFNPRSREGSDAGRYGEYIYKGDFNPRSREGSDGSTTPKRCSTCKFQSTLPRRERPPERRRRKQCKIISIHAPAKGATPMNSKHQSNPNNFNPRSREGSDPRAGGFER